MSKEERNIVRFDWAMKYMLKDPSNYYIAEGFLSALLEEDITVENIVDSESNKNFPNDKLTRVDVLIKDSKGRYVIIEIQQGYEPDYLYRVLYGTSKHIAQSIKSGDKYRHISKVISVSIAYFNLGIGDDYLYHAKTHFIGKTTGQEIHQYTPFAQNLKLLEDVDFNKIAIYPEYYFIQVDNYPNVVKKAIDEWIYWFKYDKLKQGSSSKHIDEVGKKLDQLRMPLEERQAYEKYLEQLAINENVLEGAEKKGREEGLKKGREQGIEEGIEKGLKDGQISIAKKMKLTNMPNEMISEVTGLSIKEIEKL